MGIKMKCNSCGKKEAQLMSKFDIKTSNFIDTSVLNKVLGMIDDWTQPKYIICGACGHRENA
jgi:hypothetical protein